MMAGELCTKRVRTVRPRATVRDAARRMKDDGVGTLVVLEHEGPVEGIVTDRDLVVRCLAEGRPPDTTGVDAVMTRGPVAVGPDVPVDRVLQTMADRQIRRVLVTDAEGELLGILSLDDLVEFVTSEIDEVGRLLHAQV